MPILDASGIKRLQENLLGKGAQNRILGVRLGRTLIVGKYIAVHADLKCISNLVEWCEDQQMVIGGRSRKEFLDSIKGMPVAAEEKKLGEK